MNEDDTHGGKPQPKIRLGMTLDEVCAELGPPDATTLGSKLFGGEGKITGIFTSPTGLTDSRSRSFFTKYCLWRRPEGIYALTFVHDKLTDIYQAPDGAIMKQPESTERNLPARFVWLVTNDNSENLQDVLNILIREGQLMLHPEALVYGKIDPEIAVDLPTESVITRAVVQALKAIKEKGKDESFLDMNTCEVKRIRKAKGPGSAGVLVTITGPIGDPDSFRCIKVQKKEGRDVCGKCGITQEERLRQWNAPVPRGMVKIGDERGAFMYCEHCQKGICGRCSIDLGMSAGCPLCGEELVFMDGGKQ